MTTTHTPGRWRIGDAGKTIFGPKTDAPSPAIVASVKHRADARLIALAPDLLLALTELELRTRQFIAGNLVSFPAALLPQVRAVIDAATGKDGAR